MELPRLIPLASVARRLGISAAVARAHWPADRKLYRFGMTHGRLYVNVDDAAAWVSNLVIERPPSAPPSPAIPTGPSQIRHTRSRSASAPRLVSEGQLGILHRRTGQGRKSFYEKPTLAPLSNLTRSNRRT